MPNPVDCMTLSVLYGTDKVRRGGPARPAGPTHHEPATRSEDSETSDRYDLGAGGCIEREASISVLLTAVGPPVTGDDPGRRRLRALDG